MSFTFADELKALVDLVKFKNYRRSGCVLYAKYGYFKPECTITEMVWGFCRNPCYARSLSRELSALIPDYVDIFAKANQCITQDSIFPTFDYAMRELATKANKANKTPAPKHIAFSSESTNPCDGIVIDGESCQYERTLHATDEDGEIWCGISIPDENWIDNVVNVAITIHGGDSENNELLWQNTFSRASVAKRMKKRNDVLMFQPFKHALPLLDLKLRMTICITYRADANNIEGAQIFGILSDPFCEWLRESSLEIKLCKKNVALVNMSDHTILFQ